MNWIGNSIQNTLIDVGGKHMNIEELIADSRLAFIQGKYEEALELAKRALTEDEKNADAHQCAGNAYMSKADYESAMRPL